MMSNRDRGPESGRPAGKALAAAGKRLGLALLALLLALAACEGAWRWLRPRIPGLASHPFPVIHDEHLGWRYRPGVCVRHRKREFHVEVCFDERGGRARHAPSAARLPGRPLAVFVGDSQAFGWGVEERESFAGLLRERLGLATVNLAVAGYGTDQSYLRLRRDGLPLGPDLVVYTYCRNDLKEVLHSRRYGRAKPRFWLEGERLVGRPPRPSWLTRHSVLYHSAASLLARYEPGLTPAEGATAEQLVVRLVAAMAEESRRAGAAFAVVYFDEPWLRRGLGARVLQVDAGPALARAVSTEGPVDFVSDPHWNRRGHRIIAGEIARALAADPAGSRLVRRASLTRRSSRG